MPQTPDPIDARELGAILRSHGLLAGGDFELAPLPGGITNHNFLLTTGTGERLVVRVPGQDSHLLGIDRDVELAASRMAAGLGVGPEVVAYLDAGGLLLTRFVEGTPLSPRSLSDQAVLRRVAEALRRIHSAPAIPGRFDALAVVAGYLDTARARGVRMPVGLAEAGRAVERIVATGITRIDQPVPCHNDLLPANLIDDGSRVRIVDWEYAGMGDPFFDMGNLSVNHDLSREQDALLLETWGGAPPTPRHLARLALMRVVSDLREAAWGILQAGISTLDFDFSAYAREHLERLLSNASGPAFEESLGLVAKR